MPKSASSGKRPALSKTGKDDLSLDQLEELSTQLCHMLDCAVKLYGSPTSSAADLHRTISILSMLRTHCHSADMATWHESLRRFGPSRSLFHSAIQRSKR